VRVFQADVLLDDLQSSRHRAVGARSRHHHCPRPSSRPRWPECCWRSRSRAGYILSRPHIISFGDDRFHETYRLVHDRQKLSESFPRRREPSKRSPRRGLLISAGACPRPRSGAEMTSLDTIRTLETRGRIWKVWARTPHALDERLQIRLFAKLKLAICARPELRRRAF
jgi:hypothetical protein